MAYDLILSSRQSKRFNRACREWLCGIEIENIAAKANKNNHFVLEKFSRVYIL